MDQPVRASSDCAYALQGITEFRIVQSTQSIPILLSNLLFSSWSNSPLSLFSFSSACLRSTLAEVGKFLYIRSMHDNKTVEPNNTKSFLLPPPFFLPLLNLLRGSEPHDFWSQPSPVLHLHMLGNNLRVGHEHATIDTAGHMFRYMGVKNLLRLERSVASVARIWQKPTTTTCASRVTCSTPTSTGLKWFRTGQSIIVRRSPCLWQTRARIDSRIHCNLAITASCRTSRKSIDKFERIRKLHYSKEEEKRPKVESTWPPQKHMVVLNPESNIAI